MADNGSAMHKRAIERHDFYHREKPLADLMQLAIAVESRSAAETRQPPANTLPSISLSEVVASPSAEGLVVFPGTSESKPGMKPETLTALQGSIKKWEAIVDGTGKDQGGQNCPLCQRFETTVCKTLQGEECPVRIRTGLISCAGSPYASYEPHKPETAQAELDFLVSLLPDSEVAPEVPLLARVDDAKPTCLVAVSLYKPSGKWYASFEVEIDSDIKLWEPERLLRQIDERQKDMNKGSITRGDYFVCLDGEPEYKRSATTGWFMNALFTPERIREVMDVSADHRRYLCTWGKGYFGEPRTEEQSLYYFSIARGYMRDEYEKILALEVGQVWSEDSSDVHTVRRIK